MTPHDDNHKRKLVARPSLPCFGRASFEAIERIKSRLLDGAAQHLELTYEEEAKISPDWRPTDGLGNLTVKQLRAELDRLRYWPVQEPPIFR
jgi:hypothetical protein